jgi:hypothetical protein
MYEFAVRILHSLGASLVRMKDTDTDPETEEQFLTIDYESETPITWEQYLATKPVIMNTQGKRQLRKYRDTKLKESDWIMTTDNYNSIENIQEWITYRQNLRDLPDTVTEYIWNGSTLDISKLNIPQAPQIIRKKTA